MNTENMLKTINLERIGMSKNGVDFTIGNLSYNISVEDISKKIINNVRFKTPNYPLSCDYCDFLYSSYNEIRLKTLELPFLDNQQNISCIPNGEYVMVKHKSPKFGNCFKVFEMDEEKYKEFEKDEMNSESNFSEIYKNNLMNNFGSLKELFMANVFNDKFLNKYGIMLKEVGGRSEILFHSGNTVKDTQGCILVGLCRNKDGSIVTGKSRIALEMMLETLDRVNKLIMKGN